MSKSTSPDRYKIYFSRIMWEKTNEFARIFLHPVGKNIFRINKEHVRKSSDGLYTYITWFSGFGSAI